MTRSIRPLLTALALAAVAALPATAQTAPEAPRATRAAVALDSRLAELDKALDLTDAQQAQIRRILEAQARARTQARSAERPSPEAMRARAEAMNAEMRAVLTAEQAVRFDALRAEQARARGGRGGNGPRSGGL